MAKGLNERFTRAVELDFFSGIRIRSSYLVVFHLHYVYNTLILFNPYVENLWLTKVILRGFDMALGIWVNFLRVIWYGLMWFLSFWTLLVISSIVRLLLFLLGTLGCM